MGRMLPESPNARTETQLCFHLGQIRSWYEQQRRKERTESANVVSDNRNLEDRCKSKQARNAEAVLFPTAPVITKPFTDMVAGADKGRACDDERPLSRSTGKQSVVGRGRHHRTVKVVGVVFGKTIGMD